MSSTPPGPDYGWQPRQQDYNSAPSYGQPPRKNRGGLIIGLIVLLVLVVIGAVGVLGYRLISDYRADAAKPKPSVSNRPLSKPTVTAPATKPPTTKPSTTIKPSTSVQPVGLLAQKFVLQLNANNPTAAAAFACKTSKSVIPTLMEHFLKPPVRLVTGTPVGSSAAYGVPLTGTMNGVQVSGVIAISNFGDEPMCVRAFSVSQG